MSILDRIRKKGYSARITNFNIYWKGAMHPLPGRSIGARRFEFELPFSNRGDDDGLSFLKHQARPPEMIKSIEAAEPFKVISVEPVLPITVNEGQKITIKMVLETPDYNYSGPVTIKMGAQTAEQVRIEIPEVAIVADGKRTKVTEHGEIKVLGKGAEFETSVQMYRALSFGARVSAVAVNKPFEFVRSEPALPFTINDKSSFVVSFFIKAPDYNYAGPIEITVS